jgi:hypothetical protein
MKPILTKQKSISIKLSQRFVQTVGQNQSLNLDDDTALLDVTPMALPLKMNKTNISTITQNSDKCLSNTIQNFSLSQSQPTPGLIKINLNGIFGAPSHIPLVQ